MVAPGLGSDLMKEHLREVRGLRQRLEDSIQTNDRLRQQLEDRLARTAAEKGEQTTASEEFRTNGSRNGFLVLDILLFKAFPSTPPHIHPSFFSSVPPSPPGAPTNIYIQGLDSVGQLSSEIRLLKEENASLQDQLKQATRGKYLKSKNWATTRDCEENTALTFKADISGFLRRGFWQR